MKKFFVKTISFVLVFAFIFAFAACSAINSNEHSESEQPNTQDNSTSGTKNEQEPENKEPAYVKKYSYPSNMNFSVLEAACAPTDGGAKFNHTNEFTPKWYNSNKIVEEKKGSLQVTLSTGSCSGEYKESRVNFYDNFLSHYYEVNNKEKGEISNFSINEKTGKVNYISWHILENNTPKDQRVSEEFCINKAKEFLSQFVDTQLYDVSCIWNDNLNSYTVTFTKMINGIESADSAQFAITPNGDFLGFTSKMLGEMKKETTFDFDKEAAEQAALAKAEEISLASDTYDDLELTIKKSTLTLDENNKLILVYDIEVRQFDWYYNEQGERTYAVCTSGVLNIVLTDFANVA